MSDLVKVLDRLFRPAGCAARRLASAGRARPSASGLSAVAPACLLLAVVLAGCATHPRKDRARVPDWESDELAPAPVAPVVPPAPAPAPPLVATNQPAETWIPLYRWCKANNLAVPCSLGTAPSARCALSTPDGVLVLWAGSQSVYWDGLEIRLGFAPQVLGGQTCVHAIDLEKTIEPLVRGACASLLKTNASIVIDPGHGGTDSGARSVWGSRCEKEFTLDWARRLEPLLAANGWRVFLTRSNDADLSLSNRIAFAEARQADVFLSLHFNSAAPDEREAGLETYCLTPTGMPSSVTRGYGDDAGLAFANNAFDAENLQVASRVHRALLQVNGRLDRGVRRARYLGVLRGQNRPAILVEGGYLSNPREARRIAEPAYRQRLAEAVAQALVPAFQVPASKAEVGGRDPEAASRRSEVSAPEARLP